MPVISFINRTLTVYGLRIVRLDTISQYLSRTKIFSQNERKSPGPITDADHPPRIGIRRRMVQATVKMALLNYDRWYILAHSQGTILAFNSLMETEQNLPNYLDQNLWQRAVKKLYKKAENEDRQAQGRMRPSRPNWLNPEDLLDRTKLFEKLRGVMTYGSPLSKFARLWPAIVQLNENECVFQNNFEWINIYDPTDPVAGCVEQVFKPSEYTDTKSSKIAPAPKDYAYKAIYWHLLSHINYLKSETKRKDRLVNEVVEWILTGKEFNENGGFKKSLSKVKSFKYTFIRILLWWIAGFMCTVIWSFTAESLPSFPLSLPSFLLRIQDSVQSFVSNITNSFHKLIPLIPIGLLEYVIKGMLKGILFGIGGAIIIFILGIIRIILDYLFIIDKKKLQSYIVELLRENPNKKYNIEEIENKFYKIYQSTLISEALEKLIENKFIKQSVEKYYFFPVVTFKVSPDIINNQNYRNIMNTYQKFIYDALDCRLNYAPNEEGFLNPITNKTSNIVSYLTCCKEKNWLMAINFSQKNIFLYYNLEKYDQNNEIVITKIEFQSKGQKDAEQNKGLDKREADLKDEANQAKRDEKNLNELEESYESYRKFKEKDDLELNKYYRKYKVVV